MLYKKIALLSLACCCSLSAQAQFKKAEDAVEYRKSAFYILGTHFGRIGAVVKGDQAFDKAELEKNAAIIQTMASLPWQAFPAGSNLPSSKAKPAIWQESEKFQQAAKKMQDEVTKLSAAAKTGDMGMIKLAFGAVGESCKACHQDFKNK